MSTFTDTFSAANGTALSSYNGWSLITGDAANATISGDRVSFAVGGVARYISPAAPSTTSYSVTATIIVQAGEPGIVVGIIGQLTTSVQSYYQLVHNSIGGEVSLQALSGGSQVAIASASMTLAPGTYQFELDLTPGSQVGKLNGVPIVSLADTTLAASGHTGVVGYIPSGVSDLISAFGTADTAPLTLTPDDTRLQSAYSPLQWRITTAAAVAAILGSEIRFIFTGTSCKMGVNLTDWTGITAGLYPVIAYSIDNAPQTQVQLAAGQTSLTLATGLAAGTHTVRITYIIVGGSGLSRWADDGTGTGPRGTLRVTGFTFDYGAIVASSPAYPNLLMFLGDSISECDYSFAGTGAIITGDARTDYSYLLGESLGYVTSRLTYAGTGYTATSTDGVPPVGTSWKNYDNIHLRPISSVASSVAAVVVVHGVNDMSASSSAVQAAAQALYTDLLTELPRAVILVYVPFGQAIAATITAAVAAMGNGRVKLRNLGAVYSAGLTNSGSATYQSVDGTHPNTMTHSQLRGAMVADIHSALATNAAIMGSSRTVGGGVLCGV